MPHVIVKLHEGRTEEQHARLADAIATSVAEIAGCAMTSVSVAIEEYDPQDWAEGVYRPDILNARGTLIRPPGYNPFEA